MRTEKNAAMSNGGASEKIRSPSAPLHRTGAVFSCPEKWLATISPQRGGNGHSGIRIFAVARGRVPDYPLRNDTSRGISGDGAGEPCGVLVDREDSVANRDEPNHGCRAPDDEETIVRSAERPAPGRHATPPPPATWLTPS